MATVKNISVFYSHSASNIGDIAINRGVQALIDSAFSDCQINFVSLPTSNSKFHEDMRESFMPAKNLRHTDFARRSNQIFDYVSDTDAFLRDCGAQDADLILINSGEHLFNYTDRDNAESLFWRTLPVYAAKRAGKSAVILPSTFGPFEDIHSKTLVRSIVNMADGAAAREPKSQRLQSELTGSTNNPILPDPAFFITPKAAGTDVKAWPVTLGLSMRLETWGIRLNPKNRSSQKALAAGSQTNLAQDFSVRLCQSFLAQDGREVLLLVQTDADADLAIAILDALSEDQQKTVRIERALSIDDYFEKLGTVDYLVASRFHAIILGTLMRRPATGVYFEAHGHKIPGLVEMYPELGQAFSISSLDSARTAQMVMKEIEAATGFRDGLDAALERDRQKAVEWLRGCGNKPADQGALLQAATSLAFFGNLVREPIVRKEAADELTTEKKQLAAANAKLEAELGERSAERDTALAAVAEARERVLDLEGKKTELEASLSEVSVELDRKDQEISDLEKNTEALVKFSRGAIKQAAGTIQASLQYKVGHELLRTLRRPYRAPILPFRLWKIRSNHIQEMKAGSLQTLNDIDNRLLTEGSRTRSVLKSFEDIDTANNRHLLRDEFWTALRSKENEKSSRILERLDKLQKENYILSEEKYLIKFRSALNNDSNSLVDIGSTDDRKLLRKHFWIYRKSHDFVSAKKIADRLSALQAVDHIDMEQNYLEKVESALPSEIRLLDLVAASLSPSISPIRNQVCYFLHNSLPHASGGYATRAHGLATALVAEGYRVTAVTRPGFPMDAKPELDPESVQIVEMIDGVTYRRLMQPSRKGRKITTYIEKAADVIEALLRDIRPEFVVAASNFHTGLPALIAARRLGIPFIYEVRGFWEVTRASREPAFTTHPSYALQEFMEAEICRQADAVLTLTRGMKAELVRRGVPGESITLVPNACDPDHFVPQGRSADLGNRLGIPAGVPVIGYIGSFVQYEGLDDLASACALLKARGVEFRLMIVGNENVSGGELGSIASTIKEIAERGGFADWLIMPGRVPHDEVPAYYSLIDIAPFPRKPQPVTEMVSPMKPLEALAMKKAVLVSSVDALAEMVRDGQTGVVFQKGNVEALARKIEDLIGDPELRARLGEAGRLWVESERNWNASAAIAGQVFDACRRKTVTKIYGVHKT